MPQTILMGDPSHFRVSGGANPFTRNWWGRKKLVDPEKAHQQWQNLYQLLTSLGVTIHVIPPDPNCPGLVYPANAGVLLENRFVLSNLIPTRASERSIYESFLKKLGYQTAPIKSRFEGEADFFPVGNRYIFTYGGVMTQKFVPKFTLPPWTRVYGFRSEKKALEELKTFLPKKTEVVDLELIEESHYHGDTVFCSFGEKRKFLLAYLEGLAPESRDRCRQIFGKNLIPIPARDAFFFAANSWQVKTTDDLKLIMPAGVSEELQKQIRSRGVEPVTIDVSEFLKKGGGAVKCMIGDLTSSG